MTTPKTNALFLDHFYAGIDADQFDSLKILGELIPGTAVRDTSAGDYSWSGVYLKSSSGVYLEFLKRGKDFERVGLGLAFSGLGYEQGVLENLSSQYPELDWGSHEILFHGKDPWFHSIYPSYQKDEDRAWTWAMEYLSEKRLERRRWIGRVDTPIVSFDSMNVEVPTDLFGELPNKWHRWIPGTKKSDAGIYRASIDCFKQDSFELIVHNSAGLELPMVKEICATLRSGHKVENYTEENWSVAVNGEQMQLVFSG